MGNMSMNTRNLVSKPSGNSSGNIPTHQNNGFHGNSGRKIDSNMASCGPNLNTAQVQSSIHDPNPTGNDPSLNAAQVQPFSYGPTPAGYGPRLNPPPAKEFGTGPNLNSVATQAARGLIPIPYPFVNLQSKSTLELEPPAQLYIEIF
jgi:hypothetical protein